MLDLAKNNPAEIAESGFEFNVILPDGTETEAKIKVRGKNSEIVRKFNRKKLIELQTLQNNKRRRGGDTDMTMEEIEDFSVKTAANRVITWSGIAENGEEIPATPENIISVLTRYPFIREQVMEESEEIQNFRHSAD